MAVEIPEYEKRGYLLEEFRMFRLRDAAISPVDFHYHDFHKLLIFLSGECGYAVEGRRYELLPGDVALIARGCVHRPEVSPGAPYERIIFYISHDFLQANSYEGCELADCFTAAESHVLRGGGEGFLSLAGELETALAEPGFGQALLCRSIMLRLLVELGRGVPGRRLRYVPADTPFRKTGDILAYINENLTEELPIDELAERFFVSKYHMMRSFKADTGRTIHAYISEKRLLLARDLISGGASATEACYRSGFRSYSSFSRAYLKLFGAPPRGRPAPAGLPDAKAMRE